jgi:hypothetical protein
MLTGMMWLVTRRRPLVYLGLPGAFLTSVGLAVGAWVVYAYVRTGDVGLEYAIVSIPLLIGGAVILCTGIILHSMQELVTTFAQAEVELVYRPQAAVRTPQLVKRYWPLLFFALPGAFLLLVGIAMGAWEAISYNRTRTLSIEYALLALLLSAIGNPWLIGGLILHSVRKPISEQWSSEHDETE